MEIEISQTAFIVVETGQTILGQPRFTYNATDLTASMFTEPTCIALRKIKTSCKVFLTLCTVYSPIENHLQ